MKNTRLHCNLCGHNKFETLESDDVSFYVLKCSKCRLVFVHPHPSPIQLKAHYNKNYYVEWITEQKKRREKMWQKRLDRLQQLCQKGKILDVGCGDGLFLQEAKNKGWHVNGTELSFFASTYASKMLDTEIFNGELHEAKFPENDFDVVTLWHVLEHVQDPKNYLKEIHRILKPNGLLMLAVPNANNIVMRLAYRIIKGQKIKIFSIDDKEIHLYHYTAKILKSYFDETGFNCIKFSPDFGIVEFSKRLINWISVIPFYILGIQIYNAIEAVAIAKKR